MAQSKTERAAPLAVVFDMDGLLLDTERVVLDALEDLVGRYGRPVDTATVHSMIGTTSDATFVILEKTLAGSGIDPVEFRTAWGAAAERRMAGDVPVKPGAAELLAHLTECGLPLAVATSTRSERAQLKLQKTGFLRHFRHVVCGDQVARSKPAPDIFLEAARRLETAPAACIAFEDSANGVRAAHAAGMTVVQVPDLVVPTPDLIALGHLIAPTLLAGATEVGLISAATRGKVGSGLAGKASI